LLLISREFPALTRHEKIGGLNRMGMVWTAAMAVCVALAAVAAAFKRWGALQEDEQMRNFTTIRGEF